MPVGMMYEVIGRIGHTYAIWDGGKFYFIRNKYGQEFMDTADHYDTHDVYGVIQPIREERYVGIDISTYKDEIKKQLEHPDTAEKLAKSREEILSDRRAGND